MAREPGYCLHKPTGQAYVRLNGRIFYLGKYDTDESREKYARLKAEWLTSKQADKFVSAPDGLCIAEVCLAYLDHAESYYGPGKELKNLRLAIRPLSKLYATLPARAFGPLEFRTVREWWLTKDCNRKAGRVTRTYINQQMKRIRRVVKWAVSQGMVTSGVLLAIQCVDPLKRGRTTAPEAAPVKPVDIGIVAKTMEHMTPIVRDMVQLQLLMGCRPGEIVKLRPMDVNREDDVWTIELAEHKTAHRGKQRFLYAGPKAQAILARYLLRGADQFCFSPAEAMKQTREARKRRRKTPPSCGNREGTNRKKRPRRQPGEAYTAGTYGRAIRYACDRAFPAPKEIKADPAKLLEWRVANRWAPNQLRHSRATEVRKLFGLEAASSVLGHSEITVTQIYAEADRERAITVARQIG